MPRRPPQEAEFKLRQLWPPQATAPFHVVGCVASPVGHVSLGQGPKRSKKIPTWPGPEASHLPPALVFMRTCSRGFASSTAVGGPGARQLRLSQPCWVHV